MNIRPLVAALLLSCFCVDASAQFASRYRYKSYNRMSKAEKTSHKRSYSGVSLPMTRLNFAASYFFEDKTASGNNIDSKVKHLKGSPLKPGLNNSLGFVGGTCAKLASTGKTSMIGLDIGMACDLNTFVLDPLPFASSMGDADNFKTMIFRLPLIFVYKSGGEVTMNRKDKSFFSIGGGFSPSVMAGAYRETTTMVFKLQSCLMAEGGGLLGVGLKLRATYYPGIIPYMDLKGEYVDAYQTERATLRAFTGGTFVLSAIVLVGTGFWSANAW